MSKFMGSSPGGDSQSLRAKLRHLGMTMRNHTGQWLTAALSSGLDPKPALTALVSELSANEPASPGGDRAGSPDPHFGPTAAAC